MKRALILVLLAGCASQDAVRERPLPDAIREGVAYLERVQRPDGAWGYGNETKGFELYSMVPGSHDAFRVGTTALCVMALREVGEKTAHDKGVQYLVEHGEARRDSGDLLYNIWANTYALQALAGEYRVNPDPKIRKAAEWHLDRLIRYETFIGGWNYYDFAAHTQQPSLEPTSFGTSAGLVALWEARQAGIEVPQKLVDRAVRRLEEMRLPTGAFLYGSDFRYYPQHPANHVKGSLGRSQAGNFALWLWGSRLVGEREVRAGLDTFFREHCYIEIGRKRQWPHEAWFATAPYYFFFGHYHAARIIEKLGAEAKKEYGARLAATVLPYQEEDGSWWDYPLWDYHHKYGTAYALLILSRCR